MPPTGPPPDYLRPQPPPPPAEFTLQVPGYEEAVNGEPPAIIETQRKRWALMDRLRRRQRAERRREDKADTRRMERLRHAYSHAAHFLIDIIADMEPTAERRIQRRERLERRMRVEPVPAGRLPRFWVRGRKPPLE